MRVPKGEDVMLRGEASHCQQALVGARRAEQARAEVCEVQCKRAVVAHAARTVAARHSRVCAREGAARTACTCSHAVCAPCALRGHTHVGVLACVAAPHHIRAVVRWRTAVWCLGIARRRTGNGVVCGPVMGQNIAIGPHAGSTRVVCSLPRTLHRRSRRRPSPRLARRGAVTGLAVASATAWQPGP